MAGSDVNTDNLLCPRCGYNLFGIETSTHCPECGLEIDRTAMAESVIPWTHRRRIGRVRAFLRTAALATFRPKTIARDMNRPVSIPDARKFRHICILTLWIPAMIGLCIFAVLGDLDNAATWERTAACAAVGISSWLFLLIVTGFPSLFFHPKSLSVLRQNRAIALSYYPGSAALFWLLLVGIFIAIGEFVACSTVFLKNPNDQMAYLFGGIGGLGILCLLALLIVAACRLLKLATHCSSLRVWMMGLAMPASWIIMASVVLAGIPLAMAYVAVVVASLW